MCACRHAGHSRVRFVGLNYSKLLYHIWKRGRFSTRCLIQKMFLLSTIVLSTCRLLHILRSAASAGCSGSYCSGLPFILLLFWRRMVSCVQVNLTHEHSAICMLQAHFCPFVPDSPRMICRFRSHCVNGFNGFVSAFIFATETQQTIGTLQPLFCLAC